MEKNLNLQVCFALFLAAATLAVKAQTTFFSDNMVASTINQAPTTTSGTNTSYQSYLGLSANTPTSSIAPHDLTINLGNSASVLGEVVALFTNNPVPLTSNGDYIAINVVFVGSNVLAGLAGANSTIDIGLFDSGGVPPNQGNIILAEGNATGGTQNWVGYVGRIFWSGKPSFLTRPPQAPASSSQNQDLLFSNASSTQAFNNPAGTAIGSPNDSTNITLLNGSTYTMQFVITFDSAGSVLVSNALYAGAGTGGTLIFSMSNHLATNATFMTGGFDGFAVGYRNSSTPGGQFAIMDISSIQVYGHSTPVTTPPKITSQPVSVVVPTGASCAYFVSAQGFGMTYQWHRHGTNLLDGGNISGSTKKILVISPAGSDDVLPTNSGYYVTISGTGGYSTNSVTNSLALSTATNLIWTAGVDTTWDLNTTANWQDTNGHATVFNFGDPVTFNDVGFGGPVTLTGTYLAAPSVTVTGAYAYNFSSSSAGSFAGPGNLIYTGPKQLTIGNGNTYTGGTLISNAAAVLRLENLNGFGTGPVTFGKAGGKMQIVVAGSASSTVANDIVVADDFTIQLDIPGTWSGVFSGNFSGTAGKTLKFIVPAGNSPTNQRVRMYGANTTFDANLWLNSSYLTLAPYNGNGTLQIYNGLITGTGGIIQRGGGTTVLNNTNTYSGGTTPSTGTIGFGTNTVGSVTSGPIGTGPLLLAPEVPNLTGSGMVIAYGGARTISNPIQYPSATNNLTLIIGGTNALTFTGAIALQGQDNLGTNNVRTISVTNTALTTFSGVISDLTNGVSAAYGFTKDGNGVLALSNTETYTGPTAVSGGTLLVNGALNAASAVTVLTNATLGGTGTINGPVTVTNGGTLSPGASIGTLTLNGGLTLYGNLWFEVNKSLTPSNDIATVSGALTNGGTGTVTVSNLGPALVAGDKFQLFNKPLTNGAVLGVTGGGVTWSNSLAKDGSVSVLLNFVSKPVITNIYISSGTNLVFSGNNGTESLTYHILYQTNLTKPLSNWISLYTGTFLPGGAFSGTITNTISPNVPQRFYLLDY